jgi:hypothetical protein
MNARECEAEGQRAGLGIAEFRGPSCPLTPVGVAPFAWAQLLPRSHSLRRNCSKDMIRLD